MATSRNNPLSLVDYSSEDEDNSTIQQTDVEQGMRQKTAREVMMEST